MIKVRIQAKKHEGALGVIKTAISAEIKRLEMGLHNTNRQIDKFEKKYKITSNSFRQRLTAEHLKGGDREYIEWMGELKLRERISDSLMR